MWLLPCTPVTLYGDKYEVKVRRYVAVAWQLCNFVQCLIAVNMYSGEPNLCVGTVSTQKPILLNSPSPIQFQLVAALGLCTIILSCLNYSSIDQRQCKVCVNK